MTDLDKPSPSPAIRFAAALAAVAGGAKPSEAAAAWDHSPQAIEAVALAWGLPALRAFEPEGLLEFLPLHPDPRRLRETRGRPFGEEIAAHPETLGRRAYLEREARKGRAPALVPDLPFAEEPAPSLPAAAGEGAAGTAAK